MGQLCIYIFGHLEARVVSYKSSARKSIENAVYFVYHTIISECVSTLYVRLLHAAPSIQYKAFMAFSSNWLPEGSTLIYNCKEEQISSVG